MRYLIKLLVLVCIATSCEYSLDSDYINPLQIKDSNLKSIDFTNQDTLYIKDRMTLSFSIENNNSILYSELAIDDSLIASADGLFSMNFNPHSFSSGYHILNYKLYEKANSNSLADKLGAEYFTHNYTKVILIDNEPLNELFIESTEIVDGNLEIRWPEYKGFKFERYEINIGSEKFQIEDASKNRLLIPEFAGGTLNINFKIYAKEGEQVYSYDSYSYEFGLTANHVAQDRIKVNWSESPFNSTAGYELRVYNTFNDAYELVGEYSFENGADNDIIADLMFPYSYQLELVALSQSPAFNRQADNIAFESQFLPKNLEFLGYDGSYNSKYYRIYHEAGDIYRTITYNGCCYDRYIRFNIQSGEILNEISGSLSLTPDGKRLFSAKLSDLYNLYINEYDPVTLSFIKKVHLKVDSDHLSINAVKASNNGFVTIGYGYHSFIVYNWRSGTIKSKGFATNILSKSASMFLNIDGRHIMVDDRYADLESSGSSGYESVNYSYDVVKTLPGRNKYLYYKAGKIGLSDFLGSTIKVYTTPYEVVEFIRSENDRFAVLCRDNNNNYIVEIFDYDLFEPIHSLNISSNLLDEPYKFSFTNDEFFIQSPQKVYVHSFK